MPPTRDDPHRRQRQVNQRNNPINPISGTIPQQSILFPIASNPTQTPSIFLPTPDILVPTDLSDKNIRRINREARIKANIERRGNNPNIIPPHIIPVKPPPIIPVIPPVAPVIPPRPIRDTSTTKNNIK